mgnify:CR=1
MQEWAEKLQALQETDLRCDKLQQQIDAVPKEKEEAETLLRNERDALTAAKDQVANVKKAIKSVEIDIDTVKERQRDFESKSTMIKDNDEYRAALHQIETCKKKIAELEDKELQHMEKLEEAKSQLEDEKKVEDAAEKRIAEMLADLDKRAENCRAQVEKLQAKRKELAEEVPDKMLREYERRRKSKLRSGGNAQVFVEVKDSTCMSCHMAVPPQVKTNARKGMLEQCPQCGAMLYA